MSNRTPKGGFNGLERWIPLLGWIKDYRHTQLKDDVAAGITVGVMLIPQGMAYALLAGMPPTYGLYAATIPLFIYAIFGTSRQLAVGPVAMVSLLILSGVSNLAEPESEDYISLVIQLTLMVGAIQLLLGLFRLGFLVNFLSYPVISGFTSAAALIIGLSQLKHLLGIDIGRTKYIHEILMDAYYGMDQLHLITLGIGLGGILIILFFRNYIKSVPGTLVALVCAILFAYWFQLESEGVRIVGTVPEGLPSMAIPEMSWDGFNALFTTALTISLVGFMQSIAVAKSVQRSSQDYKIDANQELIALGLANILGSFFKSISTTGGFSRTAVNVQTGAQTGIASIISATVIVLTLVFLTPLFYHLPKAVLASVIMVSVFGLISVGDAVILWRTDRRDFIMLMVTFASTLILGIEQGILVGVVLSLAMVIYQSTYPHIASQAKLPDTNYYRNVDRFPQVEERPDLLVMRFDAPLFFGNINYFKDRLTDLMAEKGNRLRLVVLNSESITGLDSSAVRMLRELLPDLKQRGINVFVSGVIGPVRDVMFKTGLINEIGRDHIFMHIHDAVNYYDNKFHEEDLKEHALQTNINNRDPEDGENS